MMKSDYDRTFDELDHLLNDPDVPLRPSLIWRLLDRVSKQDSQGQHAVGAHSLLPGYRPRSAD
jgi:hypothetical protein